MVRCGWRLDAPANPDGRSHRQWRVPREDGEEKHHQDRHKASEAVSKVDVRAAASAGLVLRGDLCEIAAGKGLLVVAHGMADGRRWGGFDLETFDIACLARAVQIQKDLESSMNRTVVNREPSMN